MWGLRLGHLWRLWCSLWLLWCPVCGVLVFCVLGGYCKVWWQSVLCVSCRFGVLLAWLILIVLCGLLVYWLFLIAFVSWSFSPACFPDPCWELAICLHYVCLEEFMEEFERVVVPRGSHLRVVFTSSQEVCIREMLVSFFIYHRPCVMFSFATVYMCSPCYLVWVPSTFVWGFWVWLDAEVYARLSCLS